MAHFGKAFDGKPMRLTFYMKTKDLKGAFQASVSLPGGNQLSEVK